jgi:hypothetical protein
MENAVKKLIVKKALKTEPNPLEDRKEITEPYPRGWTPDEVQTLEDDYAMKDTRTLANELGRTLASVQAKAHDLGLKKRRLAAEAAQKPVHRP